MKNLYGYLLTGWIFAALSAWHSREIQARYSLLARLGLAAAWIVAWPIAIVVAFITAVVRKSR